MSKSGIAKGYLHGFSSEEQKRLYEQARFFESSVFKHVDFSNAKNIIEIGSGVGAQTEILLERFPKATIECIDASSEQISTAKKNLTRRPEFKDRYHIQKADALALPFKNGQFDGAFICWLLEHVQNPVDILKEAHRVLKLNGTIFCNEVLNATFYMHPYSPATQKFWFEFNDHQWSLKGDPFVGGKLANYLLKAGFQEITTSVITHHYDHRTPKKRAAFLEYWNSLLLSGAPALLKAGKVTPEVVAEMSEEFSRLKVDPDSVIFYSWIQAQAKAL
jgi:ubiquinone/menaquinone biosynthesis C-methylase UbiE